MTIAQLIECVAGKVAALNGEIVDSTAFAHDAPETICAELKKCGYNAEGTETLFSGYTGEPLSAKVFIGPTYYQRLKHMVRDKIHSRAKGPVQILTRQPVEGRSRDGGLRFGEMERDCIISHGCSAFLKERLMDQSDLYKTCVCSKCGFIAVDDGKRGIQFCKSCKTQEGVESIEIPYACKLLFQELLAINVAPRIQLK
jgi:DNA-directed RNA polymerase II subunit RPB2